MEKKCSKCSKPFGCKNEAGGCWCEDVRLTEKTLELLKERYTNCLCPDCLKEIEARQGSWLPT